jgi:hypothetical protein
MTQQMVATERAFGATEALGAAGLSAYYEAWRENPYQQAKPVDPEQLRDVLVDLLALSAPTANKQDGKVPLAVQMMAQAVHKAVNGDNAMIQFVFKEVQHHGIEKTQAIEVPHHIQEAITDILDASGMTHRLMDAELTPATQFAMTPASEIATDPLPRNPHEIPDPFSHGF